MRRKSNRYFLLGVLVGFVFLLSVSAAVSPAQNGMGQPQQPIVPKILGSAAFRSQVQAALAEMPPQDRAYVAYWSPIIWDVEPPGAWIWVHATSPGAWCAPVYGTIACGSVFLHEAQHHADYWQCAQGLEGVGGFETEARALRRQADYAERMGDSRLAEYVRSQIGVHGAYSYRFVNPHCRTLGVLP